MSTQQPIPWTALPQIIDTYFNKGELQDFCFQLQVNYENLAGKTKKDKTRELVMHAKRHDLLEKMASLMHHLRPHLDLNIQQEVAKRLPSDDSLLIGINQKIELLHIYHEKLREWKDLHNHLDTTLIAIGPYISEVESSVVNNEVLNLNTLDRFWRQVYSQLEIILSWVTNKVHHIDKDQYGILGADWIHNLKSLSEAINQFIAELRHQQPISNTKHNRWWNILSGQANEEFERKRRLQDRTRDLEDMVKLLMSKTDKELLRTAGELYVLSREALWGQST